jgi:hypothetical protein
MWSLGAISIRPADVFLDDVWYVEHTTDEGRLNIGTKVRWVNGKNQSENALLLARAKEVSA